MSARIVVERQDALALVTLEGPERHNVLSGSGWLELARRFERLALEDDVRCVLVRGAGDRAFSAGSDIARFAEQRKKPEDVRAYSRAIGEALRAIAGCPHPTVAVIHGLCVGGGLEIAACCDVRICGESSRFGAPINRLGLTMSHDELTPLIELLGPAPVLDLLLTGDLVHAEAALRMGLVTRVEPDDEVATAGLALAGRIMGGAPLVNRWHKKFIRQIVDGAALTKKEQAEVHDAFRTDDYREGREAFMQKRSPDFSGE